MMLRTTAAAALALMVGGSSLAFADGMPRSGYYAPFSWTGLYVGADVGHGWANSDGFDTDFAHNPGSGPVHDFGMNSVIGGGYIGLNYQISRLVVGVEADWQAADFTGDSGPTQAGHFGPFTVSTDVRHYGSLRGRLGYAVDRWLVFATGGGVWSKYEPGNI